MGNTLKPPKKVFAAYLLPTLLLYTLIVTVPILMAVYNSFFDWSGGIKKIFIGLSNYKTLLEDEVFWLSFKNNLYLTVVCIVGQIGFAFLFAIILNSRYVKCKDFHRAMAYFPVTLAAVVIGFIWSMIYDYNYGLLNYFLELFGMGDLKQAWLSNPKLVMRLVSIPVVWQYIGYYLIIILSGMSSIDKSIFEVAEIDGANAFQKARYITFPLMKNVLAICVTLCIAGNMKTFDHIYVMTGGGPGNASMMMALHGYNVSIRQYRLGYGNAVSIGILVLSIAIIGITKLITNRMNKER